MILILTPNIEPESDTYKQLLDHLSRLRNIKLRVHREQGIEQSLTEIYLEEPSLTVGLLPQGYRGRARLQSLIDQTIKLVRHFHIERFENSVFGYSRIAVMDRKVREGQIEVAYRERGS